MRRRLQAWKAWFRIRWEMYWRSGVLDAADWIRRRFQEETDLEESP